jgi:hypothetical protein
MFAESMRKCSALFRLLLLICFIFLLHPVYSQEPKKIELLNADVSEFDQSINAKATRLLGNVAFKHENAIMHCDSAYLYQDENRL